MQFAITKCIAPRETMLPHLQYTQPSLLNHMRFERPLKVESNSDIQRNAARITDDYLDMYVKGEYCCMEDHTIILLQPDKLRLGGTQGSAYLLPCSVPYLEVPLCLQVK